MFDLQPGAARGKRRLFDLFQRGRLDVVQALRVGHRRDADLTVGGELPTGAEWVLDIRHVLVGRDALQ